MLPKCGAVELYQALILVAHACARVSSAAKSERCPSSTSRYAQHRHDLLWLVPLDGHDTLFLQVDSLLFHLYKFRRSGHPQNLGCVVTRLELDADMDHWFRGLGVRTAA